jgi:hypothetical protein
MPQINPALLALLLATVGTPCFAQTIEEKLRLAFIRSHRSGQGAQANESIS